MRISSPDIDALVAIGDFMYCYGSDHQGEKLERHSLCYLHVPWLLRLEVHISHTVSVG